MAKPDPFLNLLKDIGFLPLRLPREDVRPLQLVRQDGKDLNLLGDLTNALVAGGEPAPAVLTDIQAANSISGTRTSKVKFSIGISVLGSILKALSGKDLSLNIGFENAATLTFEFADVKVEKVDIILLDRFLNTADIHPNAGAVRDAMLQGHCGIVTATARTNKYMVSAQRNDGTEIGLSVPVIQQTVGAEVQVSAANSSNTKIAYEGARAVTFGAQAIKLSFNENGDFTAFNPLKAGEAAVRMFGLAAAGQPELVEVDGIFANFLEAPQLKKAATEGQ